MKTVALIPYYNHPATIEAVVEKIQTQGLNCIVVDDGSDTESKAALIPLKNLKGVTVIHREQNGGKGAAVKTGFLYAIEQGYDYALQVDADGQHNLSDIGQFLQLSQAHPNELICGIPIYGNDVPKARLYGRKITNFWIAINTLSMSIPDGMCGFRLYPLQAISRLNFAEIGDFMDFDVEILVRLHWLGIKMQWLPTAVHYTDGGVSHFRAWQDNLLISKMHSRLFFTMIFNKIKQLLRIK
ncbi:GT2 family glycosyltransferase [Cricetibacter osteomyelitidis]|uniref:GT2 family glycosyltransferase n=1 Tax=Cricetibacter osteomyelitidis TaxID=1521931 RepID=A0A4R2SWN5_9PAST|nr:glycosyltransferase family 2 protein [Cricetibacter osteomyelitidis]TCP94897.1 GT2 family glycosyltransferase [Cricetibacter osteomyelitidis]